MTDRLSGVLLHLAKRRPMPVELGVRKHVLLYGLLAGVLIAALRFIEYRWLVVEHSIEIYGGIVAALFAGLGIWPALKLTRHTQTVVVREVEGSWSISTSDAQGRLVVHVAPKTAGHGPPT